jgi:hypothetical protein
MERDTAPAAELSASGFRPRALPGWLVEGARSALFMTPRWQHLQATPGAIAAICAGGLVLSILFERLYIVGPARFYWPAITGGWLGTAVTAWACYVVRHKRHEEPRHPAMAPGAAHLFALSLAQSLTLTILIGACYVMLIQSGAFANFGDTEQLILPVVAAAWAVLALLLLLSRCGDRRRWPMLVATISVSIVTLSYFVVPPTRYWYPRAAAGAGHASERIQITQEIMESQAPLLAQHLKKIKPQRPGTIDMYTITFAPYEGQEVFRRESSMVSQVMAQRFDAGGRGLQLLNHAQTATQLPWATPLNLRRAILGLAAVMDRDEDVLFIHLTSHGAADGELAAYFWPMEVEPVMPAHLKAWLDEAGIKHRVLSISACYSGSWITPLADKNTLVMTAADAEHTSYGCGSKSELTFFGRAMYDEQLRTSTRSFEDAHAAARKVILEREQEAGKSDGYSNPQIKAGSEIGPYLLRMQRGLQGEQAP